MDIVTSGMNAQTFGNSSIQVVGWWGLFDAGEVWECGPAFLSNLYGLLPRSLSTIRKALLQQSANQSTASQSAN